MWLLSQPEELFTGPTTGSSIIKSSLAISRSGPRYQQTYIYLARWTLAPSPVPDDLSLREVGIIGAMRIKHIFELYG